jgi:hypothetical protein
VGVDPDLVLHFCIPGTVPVVQKPRGKNTYRYCTVGIPYAAIKHDDTVVTSVTEPRHVDAAPAPERYCFKQPK